MQCTDCTLSAHARRPVPGEGDPSSPLWLVGEAPGIRENHEGRPFVGKSGQELDNYLARAGLHRSACYITNLCKCWPKDDRDPKPDEIAACSRYLEMELALAPTNVTIAAVGRFATRYFLGEDAPLEMLHGIPQRDASGRTVVPCYHPAYGMRNTAEMTHISRDFLAFGQAVRREIFPESWVDPYPDVKYGWCTEEQLRWLIAAAGERYAPLPLGVDTETSGPWQTTQISSMPGEGLCIHADDPMHSTLLKTLLEHPNVLCVFHNCLHDLKVLARRGIYPAAYRDTMSMAYLLQDLPKGLKALAYRVCCMRMQSYADLVNPYTLSKTKDYLEMVALFDDWPVPDPVVMMVKNQVKIRQPQGVTRRVKNILRDMEKGPVDATDRWHKLEMSSRQAIAERLGPWEPGYLSDLPEAEALYYSCRDPDATLRVYQELQPRMSAEGLSQVWEVDLAIAPMILGMMQVGMGVEVPHFDTLRSQLEERMWRIEGDMGRMFGFPINPASSDQIRHLLFKHLGLKAPKMTKKGDKESTDHDVLEQLRGEHDAVELVVEYREANKLVGTFIDVLKAKAASAADHRVHADISTTRVVTGRLACKNPNLLAIPVRSELGRRLRDGFKARDECSLVANDYCLHGSTEIVTSEGIRAIRDIRVGDSVLSYCGGALSFREVEAAACTGVKDTVLVTMQDGSMVVCTPEHRWVALDNSLSYTKDLQRGQSLAHVRTGRAGRYPTWYTRSNREYVYKHHLVAKFGLGPTPPGYHIDHIDGNPQNWRASNLRFTKAVENLAQGGQKYWKEVQSGSRSDSNRLSGLREGLRKRRSYIGEGNPRWGFRKGPPMVCPTCGCVFYTPPCRKQKYCSVSCRWGRTLNHQVLSVKPFGKYPVYQITVEGTHQFVLANGLVSRNSQIEMRLCAHVSQDPVMLDIFRRGADIHAETASNMFGIPLDQLDEMQHRYPAKRVGFGVLYYIGPKSLRRELYVGGAGWWSEAQCEDLIQRWFKRYAGVRRFMESTRAFARRKQEVRDMFGRKRLVPEVLSCHAWIREAGLRQAANAPIQMGAQGIIKRAMRDLVPIVEEFRSMGYVFDPLIQIHDDLVIEMSDEIIPVAVPVVREVMEQAVQLTVPVRVDTKIGSRWGSMKKYKEAA